MKSSRGEVFIVPMGIILIIMLIAAVVIPNFMRDRDRDSLIKCWRTVRRTAEVMEVFSYNGYPVQLNGHKDMVDEKIVDTLGRYSPVTDYLKGCGTIFFSVTKSGYTITATARDRNHTMLTAAEGIIVDSNGERTAYP